MPRVAAKPSPAQALPLPAHSLASVCVVIPAWQPTALLLPLLAELTRRGFTQIMVIDDGSDSTCADLFAAIAQMPGVDLLRHAVNQGKGHALKTSFQHLLASRAGLAGVVTADADGQHTPEGIERVAWALLRDPSRPVFGSRGFKQGVPLRSRVGNGLTHRVFGLLTGVRFADTQTGLRGLPLSLLPELLALGGERYEYEMTVLAHLCRSGRTPTEVPIETVYVNNNRGSHFNPVWDSLRIYRVLLRLYASSLAAWGVKLATAALPKLGMLPEK